MHTKNSGSKYGKAKMLILTLLMLCVLLMFGSCSAPEQIPGPQGLSAYELYCETYNYTGTIEEWFALLKGEQGEQGEIGPVGASAYDLYCEKYDYTGTMEEWFEHLIGEKKGDKGDKGDTGEKGEKGDKGDKGDQGDVGLSAYELYCREYGYEGTIEEWFDHLIGEKKGDKGDTGEKGDKGDKGDTGDKGDAGFSAYELYCREYGYEGTVEEWFALLTGEKGDKGENGDKGDTGEKGDKGDTGEKGDKGDKGDTGDTGLSAYELYCREYGYEGTIEEWFELLIGEKKGDKGDKGDTGEKGDKGDTGASGKSAFELYCEVYGYTGTEEEWIAVINRELFTRYTVTFDLNGGTGTSDFASTVSLYPYSAFPLTVPTREGFIFLGWFTDNGVNSSQITDAHIVTKDVTLVAKWAPVTVQVTFYDQDGQLLSVQEIAYGESATPPAMPNLEGYEFLGWDEDLTQVTSDISATARYGKKMHTVTFVDEDGKVLFDEQTLSHNGVPSEPTPTQEGLYFTGWFTADGEQYDFKTSFNEDTILTARFSEYIPIYTLEDLLAIDGTSNHYILMNDINCYNETVTPIQSFSGVLDGNGNKIYAFSMLPRNESTGDICIALIVNQYGTVKNLTLSNVSVTYNKSDASLNIASLVHANEGTIENCHITDSSFSGYYSGPYNNRVSALVAYNRAAGVIRNCSVERVTLFQSDYAWNRYELHGYIGGIVAENYGMIESCVSDLTVGASFNEDHHDWRSGKGRQVHIGGIVGLLSGGGTVTDCSAGLTADILGTVGSNDGFGYYCLIGGVCGMMNGNSQIENSYASVNMNFLKDSRKQTRYYAGGVVGELESNTTKVKNCYATGTICVAKSAAENLLIGGFVGDNSGTISNSYSDVNIRIDENNSAEDAGIFCGRNESAGTISGCFALGKFETASYNQVNFFVGNQAGAVRFCYYADTAEKLDLNGNPIAITENFAATETESNLFSQSMLADELFWNAELWNINGESAPTIKDIPLYTFVTVETEDAAKGTVAEIDRLIYPAGESVALSATPTEEYNFEGWYIGETCIGTTAELTYVTDGTDAPIVAKFIPKEFKITSAEELAWLHLYPASNFILMNDIDLNLAEWEPVAEFTGVFDGNGYTVSGFTIYAKTAQAALIAVNNGEIRNLTVDGNTVAQKNGADVISVASIAAVNNGMIENCTALGTIDFIISDVFHRTNASRSYHLGGIAAINNGTVKNCTTSNETDKLEMKVNFFTEQNSYDTSTSSTVNFFAGMIVGSNNGRVEDCTVNENNIADNYMQIVNSCITYYTVNDKGHSNLYYHIGGITGINNADGVLYHNQMNGDMGVDVGSYADYKDTVDTWVVGNTYVLTHGFVGGITGGNSGSIDECMFTGHLAHESYYYDRLGNASFDVVDYIGGIAGKSSGKINNCFVGDNLPAPEPAMTRARGFSRLTHSEENTDCKIDVLSATKAYAGGIIGYNDGEVYRSYTAATLKVYSFQYKVYVAIFWSIDMYDGIAYLGGITGYSSDTAVISNCINNCSFVSTAVPELAVDSEYGSMTANQTGVVTDSYYVIFENEALQFAFTQGTEFSFRNNLDELAELAGFEDDIWTVDADGYNLILKYFYN